MVSPSNTESRPERARSIRGTIAPSRVELEGVIESSTLGCTAMLCGSGNPCCNTCDCELALRGAQDRFALYVPNKDGGVEELACEANECGVVSAPLALKHRYALTGRVLRADELAALKSARGLVDPNAWAAPEHRILMESARALEPVAPGAPAGE